MLSASFRNLQAKLDKISSVWERLPGKAARDSRWTANQPSMRVKIDWLAKEDHVVLLERCRIIINVRAVISTAQRGFTFSARFDRNCSPSIPGRSRSVRTTSGARGPSRASNAASAEPTASTANPLVRSSVAQRPTRRCVVFDDHRSRRRHVIGTRTNLSSQITHNLRRAKDVPTVETRQWHADASALTLLKATANALVNQLAVPISCGGLECKVDPRSRR